MSVLSANGLSFHYPKTNGDAPFALAGVSVELAAGGLLGVLGPNGAGKSTLLRLLAGIARPAAGQVRLSGDVLGDLSPREIARRAAWVPQELSSLFVLTVEEMVRLGRFPRQGFWGPWRDEDEKQVERALRDADLTAFRHRPLDRLSGGERRRVLMARALAQEPRLLLLDEPTAHLDPRHQMELVDLVERLRRERRIAVVAVLHDVNLAYAWCPEVLFLKGGRAAAQGPTAQVFTPRRLEEIYGLPAEVRAPSGGEPGYVRFKPSPREPS